MKSKKMKLTALLCCCLALLWSLAGCSILYDLEETDAYESTADVVISENPESLGSSESFPESVDNSSDITYTFRNESLLKSHFEKHGGDFDYETPEEYAEGANKVINNKNSLHKTEAEDGDDVYYLEETNEFVIVSTDGYIRTYFKPTQGIDYFFNT